MAVYSTPTWNICQHTRVGSYDEDFDLGRSIAHEFLQLDDWLRTQQATRVNHSLCFRYDVRIHARGIS